MIPKVVVLDDYQGVALTSADWSPLDGRVEVDVVRQYIADEDEVARRCADAEVVVAMRERTPFPRSLIEKLPDLRLLVTTGPFNAAIDVGAAKKCGIVVSGTGGSVTGAAEITWALMMAVMRGIAIDDAEARRGNWQTQVGYELSGLTIGLLGLGNIGKILARYAAAFDMNILAWSPNLTSERATEAGARLVTKDKLFSESDVVAVALKLSGRSRGIVGAEELALLGKNGFIVNASRGPIINEDALAQALADGTIAGAGLDVYGTEPLPASHPFLSLKNTVLTPHVGYVTKQGYDVFFTSVVEDIVAWLDGEPIRIVPN
jgi:phosphoglycerate dehydrogenase-like enzyme